MEASCLCLQILKNEVPSFNKEMLEIHRYCYTGEWDQLLLKTDSPICYHHSIKIVIQDPYGIENIATTLHYHNQKGHGGTVVTHLPPTSEIRV